VGYDTKNVTTVESGVAQTVQVIENMVDVAGLEPVASSLRTSFLALRTNELPANSFSCFAGVGTGRHERAPDSKKNRYRNRYMRGYDGGAVFPTM